MAQNKFGSCRRAMLSFERQPFPGTCHVDQDVAHSQAWRALGHLTTVGRVLSALHRRNHLTLPRTFAPGQCCHGQQGVVSIVSRRYFTSAPIVTFAPQHCALSRSALYAPRALIAGVTVLSDQQPLSLMPARSLRTGWPRSSSLPVCSRPTSGTAPAIAYRQPAQVQFPVRDLRKDI